MKNKTGYKLYKEETGKGVAGFIGLTVQIGASILLFIWVMSTLSEGTGHTSGPLIADPAWLLFITAATVFFAKKLCETLDK